MGQDCSAACRVRPTQTDWPPSIDPRAALNAIIYRLRSGVQWNHLPREFPDDSSVHRTMQRWVELNLFERIWALLVAECDELGEVNWEWQAADGSMGKARFGGDAVGRNPTDCGKRGVKRSWLVDGDGGPLAAIIAGANIYDTKLLKDTPPAVVVKRPRPSAAAPQHLCLDKGYDNPTGKQAVADKGYELHRGRIGEEKLAEDGEKRYPARRWVVERTFAWLSKCRALLVRYDKNAKNYLGLLQLACGLLWYRPQRRLELLR